MLQAPHVSGQCVFALSILHLFVISPTHVHVFEPLSVLSNFNTLSVHLYVWLCTLPQEAMRSTQRRSIGCLMGKTVLMARSAISPCREEKEWILVSSRAYGKTREINRCIYNKFRLASASTLHHYS